MSDKENILPKDDLMNDDTILNVGRGKIELSLISEKGAFIIVNGVKTFVNEGKFPIESFPLKEKKDE